jgi:hypothetical protein
LDYRTNERLQKALELKLFEDQKDMIKLINLVPNVVGKATLEKIDVVKGCLIKYYGYNEIERDHSRFHRIVRGKVKSNLSEYITRGEMIGKKSKSISAWRSWQRSLARSWPCRGSSRAPRRTSSPSRPDRRAGARR